MSLLYILFGMLIVLCILATILIRLVAKDSIERREAEENGFNSLNIIAGDRICLTRDHIGSDIAISKGSPGILVSISDTYVIVAIDGFSFHVKVPKNVISKLGDK